jgi:hypothetical protein
MQIALVSFGSFMAANPRPLNTDDNSWGNGGLSSYLNNSCPPVSLQTEDFEFNVADVVLLSKKLLIEVEVVVAAVGLPEDAEVEPSGLLAPVAVVVRLPGRTLVGAGGG